MEGADNAPLDWLIRQSTIAWRCFAHETKAWVIKDLAESVKNYCISLDGGENDVEAIDRASALKTLRLFENILAHEAIRSIAKVAPLNPNQQRTIRPPLPPHQRTLTIAELCRSIAAGVCTTPATPITPFRHNSQSWGSFRILKELINRYMTASTRDNPQDLQLTLAAVLRRGLHIAEILIVPWTPSGASRAPSVRAWIQLSEPINRATRTNNIQDLLDAPSNISSISQPVEQEDIDESMAPWSVADMVFRDLAKYLTKGRAPTEFSLDAVAIENDGTGPVPLASDDLVNATYIWTSRSFEIQNPIHQMALFISIIVYFMIPDVIFPTDAYTALAKIQDGYISDDNDDDDDSQNNDNADNNDTADPGHSQVGPHHVQATRRHLQTVKLYNKRSPGHSDPEPYIFTVTAIAIGFWDHRSPLYKTALETVAKKGGLGARWSKKHSKRPYLRMLYQC